MVYVFLADGFEEIEALTPVDLLRRAGVDARTVSIYPGRSDVTGARKITVRADMTIDEAKPQKEDIIVLPGGMPGTVNLLECDDLMKTVDDHNAEGGRIAAICAAPARILGSKGLLRGKKATCYPGMEPGMTGHIPTDKKVVVDGNIITASGVGVSVEFGLALVGALYGKKVQDDLAKKVVNK